MELVLTQTIGAIFVVLSAAANLTSEALLVGLTHSKQFKTRSALVSQLYVVRPAFFKGILFKLNFLDYGNVSTYAILKLLPENMIFGNDQT